MTQKITPQLSRYRVNVTLPPKATVKAAAEMMARHQVGAIMVMAEGQLQGIFTERDLLNRVVSPGRDPEQTLLQDVMTVAPLTIRIGEEVSEALKLMTDYQLRHLPLVDGEKVIGMISMRDLFHLHCSYLQDNLSTCNALLFGEAYGMAA
ncbi:MAG: cyclic nucleotide-binding/CBS domain-containing protein [Dongiaceae bacterium]